MGIKTRRIYLNKDHSRTLEGRQQELREAQNRLAEARVAALKQEAEVRPEKFS